MKKVLVLCLSLLLVLTLFIGCAEKTETVAPAAEEEKAEVADAAESFDGQIKIGVTIPITGNYAEHGKGLLASAELALEDINADGGIMGKELVLDIQDSASDPTGSVENARKFIEDEDIVAIMGDFASGCSLPMAPICQEAGIVQLTPSSSSPDIPTTGDYIFAIVGQQSDEQPFNAKYIFGKYLEAKTAAIIYVNNDWGVSIYDNLSAALATEGIELVASEAVTEGDKDFSAVLSKVKKAEPDAIFLGTQVNESANIINQMAQTGYSSEVQVVISGGSYSDQLLELIGNNGDGMLTTLPYFITQDDERGLAYQERFLVQSDGLTPNIMTIGMYDGLMMMKEAIERAGSTDRAAIKDALAQTDGFDGITGTITFDENGAVHRKYMIIGIEDGKWIGVTDFSYMD